ncbi:MAG: LLM class flavin-dependent oxidoreductase [Acidimicrobiia bacterium]|nr:LLM class flavin-dependent oxidoreductase [Acidimicrobiia bacterium]
MEFSLFNSLYTPHQSYEGVDDQWSVEAQRLKNEVAWTVAADKAGFKYTWATEHHFLTEYSHLSASEAFLGYLAGVTERIHLGSGIFNITPPVSPPAKVAEKVAMLDHLSNGRFEFGVGRGSSTTEQRGFGITDPEDTKKMVDEVLPEFKKMWAQTEYSFDGEYFSMPPRNVLPKPYSDPHPPMWIAAGNPGTFEKAARLGLGVLCFTTGSPETLKPLIEVYKNNIDKAEPVGEYVNDNIMVTSQMLCLEDGQRARDISCNMTSGFQNTLVFHYLDTFPKPEGIPAWPAQIPDPTPEMLEQAIEAHLVMSGTPDEVIKSVKAYEDAGADQVCFGMLSSTMPIEVAIEAVETFGKHVIPEFDKDPVHRSAQMREAYVAKRGPKPKRSLGLVADKLPVL